MLLWRGVLLAYGHGEGLMSRWLSLLKVFCLLHDQWHVRQYIVPLALWEHLLGT